MQNNTYFSAKDVVMTKCFQEKEEALKSKDISGAKEVFVTECNSDGSFASIQCHKPTGVCWCVSKDGKPITRSSTDKGKPDCNPKRKYNEPSQLIPFVRK